MIWGRNNRREKKNSRETRTKNTHTLLAATPRHHDSPLAIRFETFLAFFGSSNRTEEKEKERKREKTASFSSLVAAAAATRLFLLLLPLALSFSSASPLLPFPPLPLGPRHHRAREVGQVLSRDVDAADAAIEEVRRDVLLLVVVVVEFFFFFLKFEVSFFSFFVLLQRAATKPDKKSKEKKWRSGSIFSIALSVAFIEEKRRKQKELPPQFPLKQEVSEI